MMEQKTEGSNVAPADHPPGFHLVPSNDLPHLDEAPYSQEDAEKELELFLWLHSSKDVIEFKSRIETILQGMQFDRYSHCNLAVVTDALSPFGNLPGEAMDQYAKEEFYRDDLVAKHVMENSHDMVIEDELYDSLREIPISSALLKRNLDIQNLFAKFDLAHRLAIPIHGEDYRAVFTVCMRNGCKQKFSDTVRRHSGRLLTLARTVDQVGRQRFHEHFHGRRKNARMPIGMRPLELFDLLIKDLTLIEAAKIMGITESTAKNHVAAGKKVFGAHTLHGLLIAVERSGIMPNA